MAINIFSSSSSSSSSSSKFSLFFSPSQYPNSSKLHLFTIAPLKTPHHSAASNDSTLNPVHAHDPSSSSSSSSPVLTEKPQKSSPQAEDGDEMDGGYCLDEEIVNAKKSLEELLVVRRPLMEFSNEEDASEENAGGDGNNENELADKVKEGVTPLGFDEGLSRFAKKMPIFEPKVVESGSGEKPLLVNLDLALYKAKILSRNYRYEEAEEILRKVDTEANALVSVSAIFLLRFGYVF